MITSDEQIEKHFCVHRIGPLHHPLCPLCLNDHLPVRAGEKKGNIPVIDCDNIQLFLEGNFPVIDCDNIQL